jgi:hypothetical protein
MPNKILNFIVPIFETDFFNPEFKLKKKEEYCCQLKKSIFSSILVISSLMIERTCAFAPCIPLI